MHLKASYSWTYIAWSALYDAASQIRYEDIHN